MTLPIDKSHLEEMIEISVWDEDTNRKFQGSDDPLGRTSLPLKQVVDEKTVELSDKVLEKVKSGKVTARLEWVPAVKVLEI